MFVYKRSDISIFVHNRSDNSMQFFHVCIPKGVIFPSLYITRVIFQILYTTGVIFSSAMNGDFSHHNLG